MIEAGGTILGNTTLRAADGSTVNLRGMIMGGVQIATIGSGSIRSVGAILDTGFTVPGSVNLQVFTGLTLQGAITNDGRITVGELYDRGQIRINGAVTLAGSGTLTMNGGYVVGRDSVVGFSSFPQVHLDDQLTNGVNHTIRGTGSLGLSYISILNQGTITADLSGQGLYIAPNAGGLTKHGLIEARNGGVLTLSGDIQNSGGTIRVATGSTVSYSRGTISGGQVRTESGGTLSVNAGTNRVSATVVNNGDVYVQSGTSVMFSGPVSGAGRFSGLGASIFENLFHVGNSPAVVVHSGPAIFGDTSTIEMDIGGTSPGACGTCFAQLVFSNHVTFNGGALKISLWNGFSPGVGNSFQLFQFSYAPTGTFGHILLPSLADGGAWDTTSLYSTGTLSVAAVPEPSSYLMMILGLLLISYLLRHQSPSTANPARR